MWLIHFSSQAAVGNSIMNDRLVRLAAWLLEELGPYGDTRGWGWGEMVVSHSTGNTGKYTLS